MKRLRNTSLIKKLMKDPKFKAEYYALAPEYELLEKMLKARMETGLSQAEIAKRMHTTTSVIGRLETSGGSNKHSPTLQTLERYATALGYKLNIELIPLNKKHINIISRSSKNKNRDSSTINI